MTSSVSSLDQINLLNAGSYAERGYPWEEWALLRREAPVYWYERAGGRAVLGDHEVPRHPAHLARSGDLFE